VKVDDFEVPDDLYYTKEHDWLKKEGEKCRIGLTDYAQKSLREIVFVDLPQASKKFSQMQSMGTVESVKAVADVYSPVSGEVVEVNQKLVDSPELVNNSPYGEGWIAVIKPSNLEAELKNLMNAKSYGDFLKASLSKK